MIKRIELSLLFGFLLFSVNLFPQQNNFEVYSIQEGLQNSSIFKIFQDSRGILWLGTQGGGLIRFEGGRFSAYTENDGLADNSVREITEDHSGNLWIGTESGLNMFN